jgi:hypothetical protein
MHKGKVRISYDEIHKAICRYIADEYNVIPTKSSIHYKGTDWTEITGASVEYIMKSAKKE